MRLDDESWFEFKIETTPWSQYTTQIDRFFTTPNEVYIPVHMPAFHPVMHSLGAYQDSEASINCSHQARSEASNIHKQYTSHAG